MHGSHLYKSKEAVPVMQYDLSVLRLMRVKQWWLNSNNTGQKEASFTERVTN